MSDTTNKPVHEIRYASIKAAIWKQETEKGKVHYNVTTGRLYKDGKKWKTSSSFGLDDLPKVQLCIGQAYKWILTNGSTAKEATKEG